MALSKIESAMIAAIRSGVSWQAGNTQVTCHETGADVYLHGHNIAMYRPAGLPLNRDTQWEFCLAGWNTKTTRSRINAISREFLNGWAVSTKQGQPMRNDSGHMAPIGHKEWFTASP